MRANDQNTLCLLGEQAKVTTTKETAALVILQSPRPGQPTPELLRIIGVAVAPAAKRRAEGRGGKC